MVEQVHHFDLDVLSEYLVRFIAVVVALHSSFPSPVTTNRDKGQLSMVEEGGSDCPLSPYEHIITQKLPSNRIEGITRALYVVTFRLEQMFGIETFRKRSRICQ